MTLKSPQKLNIIFVEIWALTVNIIDDYQILSATVSRSSCSLICRDPSIIHRIFHHESRLALIVLSVFIDSFYCRTKPFKTSTITTLPPPEAPESSRNNHDTHNTTNAPSSSRAARGGPCCQSTHITSTIHQCRRTSVLPVSHFSACHAHVSKVEEFHNFWTLLGSDHTNASACDSRLRKKHHHRPSGRNRYTAPEFISITSGPSDPSKGASVSQNT